MHDLCEGIIPSILELILSSICSKHSTGQSSGSHPRSTFKKILENAIKNYDFYEGQPQLVWGSAYQNGCKIDGTAVQVTKKYFLF